MTIRTFAISVALVCLGTHFSSARAFELRPVYSAETEIEAIQKLEHEWLDHESDKQTLERVLGTDFLHQVSAGVFLSKEQHINWCVHHPRPADRKARFETLAVQLYGDTAIARGIVDDSDFSGRDLRRTIFTDVFVRRNGNWQAVSASENPIFAGRNGPH